MDIVLDLLSLKLWICWILFITRVESLQIVEYPSNITTLNNKDVLMKCVTTEAGPDDDLEWVEYVTTGSSIRIWSTHPEDPGIKNTAKYQIEGHYNLRIKNAQITDGGRYGCKLLGRSVAYYTAYVTVFESVVCGTRSENLYENDQAYISCHVTYGGPTAPDTHFYDPYTGEKLLVEYSHMEDQVYISANFSATYEEDDKRYRCEVELKVYPYYHDFCTSSINVFYSVRNLTFMPDMPHYYTDEGIRCSAMGNPDPLIWWEKVVSPGNHDVINDTVLALSPEMSGLNIWNCMAENSVLDNTTIVLREFTFNVWSTTAPGSSVALHSSILLIVAGLLLLKMTHI